MAGARDQIGGAAQQLLGARIRFTRDLRNGAAACKIDEDPLVDARGIDATDLSLRADHQGRGGIAGGKSEPGSEIIRRSKRQNTHGTGLRLRPRIYQSRNHLIERPVAPAGHDHVGKRIGGERLGDETRHVSRLVGDPHEHLVPGVANAPNSGSHILARGGFSVQYHKQSACRRQAFGLLRSAGATLVGARGNVYNSLCACGLLNGRNLPLPRSAPLMIPNAIAITPELIEAHGLKPDEYDRILALIGRTPTFTELGIFSAMWNEHCSYKSSKKWLKTLPTTGPRVILGPGENAGVVDIGDGEAVVFKMESHNHPSYIEPYQGAATGVGGILRDVFTMGARPIAAMNALRFGEPDHPRTRHLVSGVVAGVGGYGNSFGVPTVGGEVEFHASYNGNCLVNAFAAGLLRTDAIFLSKAEGVGLPVVYLGAKTGRDGVGGATMASAEFDETIEEKRPTVQVGDPFTEKCLLEACLELMKTGAVVAIQDMGAAGLTCSAVEMGAKGNLGVTLELDRVPVREERMSAYEMMLSESQERMLMVLRPEKEAEAKEIFRKWVSTSRSSA